MLKKAFTSDGKLCVCVVVVVGKVSRKGATDDWSPKILSVKGLLTTELSEHRVYSGMLYVYKTKEMKSLTL